MKYRFLILLATLACWTGSTMAQTSQTPNDPLYPLQWGYDNHGQVPKYTNPSQTVGCNDCDADVKEAWTITTGSPGVVIAIIDGGADYTHPDFSTSRLWVNTDEIPNNGIDDDGNGYIDDRNGYDFGTNSGDPSLNPHAHGIAMTSILAATPNNNVGLVGVDWKAKLMILKVVDAGGFIDPVELDQALRYAADNGADIVTMSFGWRQGFPQPGCSTSTNPNCTLTTQEFNLISGAVDYAYNAGVALFAANGNDDEQANEYPAAFSRVMAMGAASPCMERKSGSRSGGPSCEDDTRGEFNTAIWGSNYGAYVDLLAPGTQTPSADAQGSAGYSGNTTFFMSTPDGNFVKNFYGTSDASPFAAGVAGLMLSVNPSLTNTDIYDILRCTAEDIGPAGFDNESGHGMINAHQAVLLAQSWGNLPANVTIANQNISTSQLYQASNTIAVGPNVNITQAVNVDLVAGNSITFTPNFTMVSGATMEARLDPGQTGGCTTSKAAPELAAEPSSPEAAWQDATLESYPNPFREATTLRFELPEQGHATLQIYNMQGARVATLFDGEADAQAAVEAEFRGDDLPAGIYMARLTTEGGVTLTRRLMLQK